MEFFAGVAIGGGTMWALMFYKFYRDLRKVACDCGYTEAELDATFAARELPTGSSDGVR